MAEIKAIREPMLMTRAELLIEVARLRKGIDEEGNIAWCPVCEDWYYDNDDWSEGCRNHDVEVYGTASDVMYANGLDNLGYRRKDAKEAT